jgi:hypothetical protein
MILSSTLDLLKVIFFLSLSLIELKIERLKDTKFHETANVLQITLFAFKHRPIYMR